GWANLGEIELPEHIFLLKEYVPFEWLFARMKLLVHHGGSGTVALGLRSGIPQIIIPFFADQPEWGKKLATLGVAPAPIPILELTTENLTSSISQALNNTNLQQQAEAIAQSLKLENGIEETVQIIQQYLSSSVR
ncbi:MAG: nucleotide disphospho-sugar-binding domain-containing protein, partial [Cyanobacteria bacterium J06600_6]